MPYRIPEILVELGYAFCNNIVINCNYMVGRLGIIRPIVGTVKTSMYVPGYVRMYYLENNFSVCCLFLMTPKLQLEAISISTLQNQTKTLLLFIQFQSCKVMLV